MTVLRFFCAVLVFLSAPAAAASLADGGRARVTVVVDGDTVILDRKIEGSDQVRLVGIQAPKLPLGRPGFKAWPLAEEARERLRQLVLGRTVTLGFGGRRMDRHGRLLAHLHDADGEWVQGRMLSDGLARVYSFPDNRSLVADMLALETAARAAARGIWRLDAYAVRGPEDLEERIGSFQLVEGRVFEAATVGSRTYLNFAADWRSDFTISLDKRALGLFRRAGVDVLALKDRRVRVRGWLKKRNGPMIEATHPEQLEVLTD